MTTAFLAIIRNYPLPTACVFASTRGFLGDAMAQKLEHEDRDFVWDENRSCTYTAWGCASAIIYDFAFYSRLFPRWFPSYVSGKLSKTNVAKAVGFDTFLLTPFAYFPMFYVFKDTVVGSRSAGDACVHYSEDFFPQNGYAVAYWTPINIFMFGAVRPEYRVGFTSAMALGYVVVLSWITESLTQKKKATATTSASVEEDLKRRRTETLRRRVSKIM